MQRSVLAALLASMLAVPFASHAQSASPSSYVKLGVGQARADIDFWGKDTQTAASLAYGIPINPTFDVELGYIYFGRAKYADVGAVGNSLSARSEALYLAAVGKIPVHEMFDVYGKLGASYHWNKWTGVEAGTAFRNDDNRLAPMVGVGVSWKFMPSWAADLEYAYFNDVGKSGGRSANIDLWTVGVKYLW